MPIKNEQQRQSYYGAINYRTGKVTLKGYPQGNTENTIKFVKDLIEQNKGAKLVIIWDGATYHYSKEFREYLKTVNQGKTEEQWLIRCIKLAPQRVRADRRLRRLAKLCFARSRTKSHRRCLATRERNVTQILESLQEFPNS